MTEEVDEPTPLPAVLTLTVGPPANGGRCVARHEGRVVFVRYALPGETVQVRRPVAAISTGTGGTADSPGQSGPRSPDRRGSIGPWGEPPVATASRQAGLDGFVHIAGVEGYYRQTARRPHALGVAGIRRDASAGDGLTRRWRLGALGPVTADLGGHVAAMLTPADQHRPDRTFTTQEVESLLAIGTTTTKAVAFTDTAEPVATGSASTPCAVTPTGAETTAQDLLTSSPIPRCRPR